MRVGREKGSQALSSATKQSSHTQRKGRDRMVLTLGPASDYRNMEFHCVGDTDVCTGTCVYLYTTKLTLYLSDCL